MRGMEYLRERPMCEFPDFERMFRHTRQRIHEHKMGWTPRKRRNNDRRSSMDKTGQAARLRQRELILKIYGPICWLCLARGVSDRRAVIDLDLVWPDVRCFTRDHVIPRSLGGSDDIGNLRPAHHECNRNRGNEPVVFNAIEDGPVLALAA